MQNELSRLALSFKLAGPHVANVEVSGVDGKDWEEVRQVGWASCCTYQSLRAASRHDIQWP